MKYITRQILTLLIITLASPTVFANQDNVSLFPMGHYSQTITDWINPASPDYDKPLVDEATQQQLFQNFFQHYYGSYSPWDMQHIKQLIDAATANEVAATEENIIKLFTNDASKSPDDTGYGENFRPYASGWIAAITKNVDPAQLNKISYLKNNRAIAIDNTNARALPTDDPFFYSYTIAGEGYPFDNLQMSAVWAGTPLYIIAESLEHNWSLVVTPEFIGWVKSNRIARVSDAFINQWTTAAKKQLGAITQTQTSVMDDRGHFLLSAYVGAVFPLQQNKILVPAINKNRQAVIVSAPVAAENIALMPVAVTPHHFANLMQTLIGRPYGWGNYFFYNDCSGETKNLLTPFGIWLPRNSFQQTFAGKMTDISDKPPQERLDYLAQNGKKFLTLIYIGGHIIMYVGNFPDPNSSSHALMDLTYQNMWGFAPQSGTRRAVVGGAVFMPLLLQYPEDTTLSSQASKKYFQVIRLDQEPDDLSKLTSMSLKAMMTPTN